MIVPLTPVRCLYRGVDLYGEKSRHRVGRSSRFTYAQFGERASGWPPGWWPKASSPATGWRI